MNRKTLVTGVLACGLFLFGGCQEPEPPLHWSLVVDGSDSGLGLVANRQTIQQFFQGWARQALHRPTSSFAVLLVGQSRDTARQVIHLSVPAAWGSGVSQAKKKFVLQGLEKLSQLELTGGSAIAEAIQVATLGLRERPGIWSLVVLSDLRQVTPGQWNFERAVPSPEAFIRWMKQEYLLADLQDISVEVIGLHSQRGPNAPEFTATQERQLRILWDVAFQQMGTTQVTLRAAL